MEWACATRGTNRQASPDAPVPSGPSNSISPHRRRDADGTLARAAGTEGTANAVRLSRGGCYGCRVLAPVNLFRAIAALVFFALIGSASTARAQTNQLNWLVASNRVDARFQGMPLNKVLARVARVTGWEILVEPGTQKTVTAGFTGLSQREALSRILGDLSFALLPRTNAQSRLLIFRSSRESATEVVEAETEETKEGPIREEFILRVKAGVKLKAGEVERIAKLFGGELVAGIDQLGAYKLRFPTAEAAEKAREAILKANETLTAEDNYRIAPPENPPEKAGTPGNQVKVPPLGDKNGPIVALIDTAVQTLPPDMEALILSRTQVAPGSQGGNELEHGTSMAQAMFAGMEKAGESVRVLSYDVYGGSATTSTFDVARALLLAAQNGASIFNLSLGGNTPSPVLSDTIAWIRSRGGLVIIAAGNVPGQGLIFPAADPNGLAVTASDPGGGIAAYANTAQTVDLIAPGSALVTFQGQTYLVSGTSAAAAWTSGYASGEASKNGTSPQATVPLLLQELGFQGKKPGP